MCVFFFLQADYDARAVGRTPPSQELGDRRLLSPGAVEDEENVTGLLEVNHYHSSSLPLMLPSLLLCIGRAGSHGYLRQTCVGRAWLFNSKIKSFGLTLW